METQTALILTVQLIALFSIAGALLLYLLCKVRGSRLTQLDPSGSILITSADTALGLQLCTYFANKGCRVFAGMREPTDSLPAKLLKGWMKARENYDIDSKSTIGSVVPLKLDVTKEDVLREAFEQIGAYLNASERGILAVVNTSGAYYKGRLDSQDSLQWEIMYKNNVISCLKVVRTFLGLLKPTRGRFVFLGAGNTDEGAIAFTAARNAVEGCATALRADLKKYGVNVITLNSEGVPGDALFKAPIPLSVSDCEGIPTQFSAEILTYSSLEVIESALFDPRPNDTYYLSVPANKFYCKFPCRSATLKLNSFNEPSIIRRV